MLEAPETVAHATIQTQNMDSEIDTHKHTTRTASIPCSCIPQIGVLENELAGWLAQAWQKLVRSQAPNQAIRHSNIQRAM